MSEYAKRLHNLLHTVLMTTQCYLLLQPHFQMRKLKFQQGQKNLPSVT